MTHACIELKQLQYCLGSAYAKSQSDLELGRTKEPGAKLPQLVTCTTLPLHIVRINVIYILYINAAQNFAMSMSDNACIVLLHLNTTQVTVVLHKSTCTAAAEDRFESVSKIKPARNLSVWGN